MKQLFDPVFCAACGGTIGYSPVGEPAYAVDIFCSMCLRFLTDNTFVLGNDLYEVIHDYSNPFTKELMQQINTLLSITTESQCEIMLDNFLSDAVEWSESNHDHASTESIHEHRQRDQKDSDAGAPNSV